MTGDRTGADAAGAAAADRLAVLHAGDPEAVAAVREYAERECDHVTVRGVSATGAAAESLRSGEPDCLVLDSEYRGIDVRRLLEACQVPVVLFTDADAAAVDDVAFAAADTFVENAGTTRCRAFLVEKVEWATGCCERDGEYACASTLTAVEESAGSSGQFLVDPDGAVVWASDAFGSVFPVDAVEGPAPPIGNLYDRLGTLLSDAPDALATVRRCDRGDLPGKAARFTVPTDDGPVHYRHVTHPLPDDVGDLRLEVFEDVTATVRRESRIDLLELLVRQAQDGLYTLDEHGVVDFCNESFAAMLGYEPDAVIGEHAAALLDEGELAKGQALVQALREDPDRDSAKLDMTFRDHEGERLEVSIHFTLLSDDDGAHAGLMGVARDITDRKDRERTLEQYRTLVESAGDPMYVLDADGRIELLNEAMVTFVGRSRAELVGSKIGDLLGSRGTDNGEAALAAVLEDEVRFESFESRLTDADGDDRRFEVTVGAITDDGEVVGSVGTLRDVTDRERRREELDLLKEVFARVLRHDLRSELSVVMCNAEEVAARTSGETRDLARTIVDRAEVLEETAYKARTIERVLDTDAGRTPQNVRDVVTPAVQTVARRYPAAEYETRVPGDITVRAHPELPQAVENLVENGVVHAERERPRVRVGVEANPETVAVRVVDDGPGIPAVEREVIERATETPLKHSSGLGLWLVNWIVEHSGGDLTFERADGETVVTIRLDRA